MDWPVYEAVIEGLRDFAAAQTVAFMGLGEPLLHPRFVDMVALAHQRGLRTEVTSNALLLNEEMVRRLLEAGLDQFVVSIDGASAEAFGDVRDGASLRQVIRNVRMFWDVYEPNPQPPVRIGIEFVAMRRNIRELPNLMHVASQIGASFILVTNVLPYTAELQDEVLYKLRATSYAGKGGPYTPMWILPKMDFTAESTEPLLRVLRTQPNLSYLDMDLGARNGYCPFIQAGALAVSWNGAVSPCPPLLHSYTCYIMGRPKLMRRYEIGRLPAQSLRAIWDTPSYVAFRERVRQFDFPPCTDCGCDMAERNEEDCFGNPFPVCGDCLWARGIIRCA
jgi:MoaA/NifB/PqqE/SkfB family radical SAM enzyme